MLYIYYVSIGIRYTRWYGIRIYIYKTLYRPSYHNATQLTVLDNLPKAEKHLPPNQMVRVVHFPFRLQPKDFTLAYYK